ncbi:MAG: tRNA pseudouridine(13) synthase TruD [Planctomycetota bacterium]|jgi:tRNA pseudouridine13 synthase
MPGELPYLTADLPGVGGRIKVYCEDFRVDEVPLYAACGDGTHLYFQIRKAAVPTPAAVERIARHMNVRPSEIGLAGLKDAQAMATQWLSLEHADEKKLAVYRDAQIQILEITRHTNKLRPGHLAGNRFTIRIRDIRSDAVDDARTVLAVLSQRGVPNYFGRQRFGMRDDTDTLGAALIREDLAEFLAIYLGRPRDDDPPDCRAAREAFDEGDYPKAMDCWPRHYGNERRVLAAYKRRGKTGAAAAAIDKRMKRLFVSACQSRIFNDVVAARINRIDRVLVGDLAKKTDTGGVFPVEDAEVEQPRAAAGEISATGPIVGSRARLADREPGEIELRAVAASGLAVDDFVRAGRLKIKGGRRPLRFFLGEPELSSGGDQAGGFMELSFTAPSGCYATVALREIMKADD